VPVGLAALVLVVTLYQLPHTRTDHRVDYGGAVTLLLGLVPLLIVAEQGDNWGWTSPRVLVLVAAGIAGLVGFVLIMDDIERRKEGRVAPPTPVPDEE